MAVLHIFHAQLDAGRGEENGKKCMAAAEGEVRKGHQNPFFRFFKLTVFTVTTVTMIKIKHLKATTTVYLKAVTVNRKLIYTVTNCYKLLQPNTDKGLNIQSRYSSGL